MRNPHHSSTPSQGSGRRNLPEIEYRSHTNRRLVMASWLLVSNRAGKRITSFVTVSFLPATPLLIQKGHRKAIHALRAKQGNQAFLRGECTGTSVTLWTGDLHYNPLVLQRPWVRSLLVLHLEICQQSRLWECGNPAGISKECGKRGKPASWLSTLSILCHFHGLLWKRASHNQIV
jgi:hypothetical protein